MSVRVRESHWPSAKSRFLATSKFIYNQRRRNVSTPEGSRNLVHQLDWTGRQAAATGEEMEMEKEIETGDMAKRLCWSRETISRDDKLQYIFQNNNSALKLSGVAVPKQNPCYLPKKEGVETPPPLSW